MDEEKNSQHKVPGLRYQDATARTAGIDLKTTVRVLRALSIVAQCNHDKRLHDAMERILSESTANGSLICELEAKPVGEAVAACDTVFKRILKRYGWERVRALQRLEDGCPYKATALIKIITDE